MGALFLTFFGGSAQDRRETEYSFAGGTDACGVHARAGTWRPVTGRAAGTVSFLDSARQEYGILVSLGRN